MRYIIYILVAVLIITPLMGCSETDEKGATGASVEMVPQRADQITYINISDILADRELEDLYARLPKEPDDPQTKEEGIATAREEWGIDLRDVEEVTIFSDTSSGAENEDYMGAVAVGSFDEESLITSLEETYEVSLHSQEYKGYEIWIDEEEEGAIAFPDDNILVLGTPEAVEDVIDVEVGDEPALTGDVLANYNQLDGAIIKMAAKLAPEYTEDALGQAYTLLPVPIDISAAGDIETAGLTLDREEESIVLDVELCFTSAQSAKDVKELISFVKFALQTPEMLAEMPGDIEIPEDGLASITELLDKLDVAVTDSCLSIDLSITLDELEQLYTEFEPAQ